MRIKVIIVSDNHGHSQILQKIYDRHAQEVDYFIHCGDSQLAADHPAMRYYLSVSGNCDYGGSYPKERIVSLPGQINVFVTHGHLYQVKMSMSSLHHQARAANAAIVCYGHSHQVDARMIAGTLFINPGSTLFPRNTRQPTYASLAIYEHLYEVEILDVSSSKAILTYQFDREEGGTDDG